MWRPDRSVRGPDRPTARDIEPLNRVFAEAFTDRYSRDGLVGVRVPQLNPLVWRYAIEDAGDGAMVWRDADGQLVAFNMVHRSGTEGWMGPLAVRPDRQGEGLGSTMVRRASIGSGARAPRPSGWRPCRGRWTTSASTAGSGLVPGAPHGHAGPRRAAPVAAAGAAELLSAAGPAVGRGGSRSAASSPTRCCRAWTSPGSSRSPASSAIGDTTLVRDGDELIGFALWHSTPLAAGRPKDELRVLKLVARGSPGLRPAARRAARPRPPPSGSGGSPSAARPSSWRPTCGWSSRGYRVHWTDLRMLLPGQPPRPARDGIVMSNWEI